MSSTQPKTTKNLILDINKTLQEFDHAIQIIKAIQCIEQVVKKPLLYEELKQKAIEEVELQQKTEEPTPSFRTAFAFLDLGNVHTNYCYYQEATDAYLEAYDILVNELGASHVLLVNLYAAIEKLLLCE